MRSYEQVEFTNMCMIMDAAGRIAMLNRTGNWPGYALPGGHVEMGEPFTDSVIREIREETGLTITHPRLCAIKDWIQENGSRYVVLLYRTSEYSGTFTSSTEGKVEWVHLDQLDHYTLAEGMRSTLDFFLNEDLSEQWYDAAQDYCEVRK